MLQKQLLWLLLMPFYLWGITITENTTLSKDMVYNEDVIIQGTVLNLNGYTMTINGDLNITGANARLQMTMSNSKLIVKKNIIFAGASTYKDLTNGVIELGGNFYQIGNNFHGDHLNDTDTTWNNHTRYSGDNEYSFYSMDKHKVVLNGNSKQIISFEAPNHSRFNHLEIQNSSSDGVVFEQLNILGEWKRNNNRVTITDIRNLTLTENYTISNDVEVVGGILNLNGYTLKINGNLKFSSSSCRLQMKKADDKLIVTGDLIFGGASTYQDLTNGVIELGGNFYQIGNNFHVDHLNDTDTTWNNHTRYSSDNEYSFYAMDKHKVVLNGKSQQRVVFESADHSRFANLEISNEDVIFTSEEGKKIRVISDLYTSQTFYNSTYKNHELLTYNRYRDINKVYMELVKGLYLTSLPVKNSLNEEQIKSIFSDENVSYVLKYNSSIKKWQGFSSKDEIVKKMQNSKVSELTTINAGEGIFISTDNDTELKFPRADGYKLFDKVGVENLGLGWHLLGTNKEIKIEKLIAKNSNIKVIWFYKNGKWSYYSEDDDIKAEYHRRDIPLSEDSNGTNIGFWVYVE